MSTARGLADGTHGDDGNGLARSPCQAGSNLWIRAQVSVAIVNWLISLSAHLDDNGLARRRVGTLHRPFPVGDRHPLSPSPSRSHHCQHLVPRIIDNCAKTRFKALSSRTGHPVSQSSAYGPRIIP